MLGGLRQFRRFQHFHAYKVLGVSHDASTKEIRQAFLERARKCHPDTVDDTTQKDIAHRQFLALSEAYDLVSTPQRKLEYDALLRFHSTHRSGHAGAPHHYHYAQTPPHWDDEFKPRQPGENEAVHEQLIKVLLGAMILTAVLSSFVTMRHRRERFTHFRARGSGITLEGERQARSALVEAQSAARTTTREEQVERLRVAQVKQQ